MGEITEALLKKYRSKKYDYIPSDRNEPLQVWFEEWLKARFGADYWQMSKECKQLHFASCAAEIMMLLDSEIKNLKENSDYYVAPEPKQHQVMKAKITGIVVRPPLVYEPLEDHE